MPLALWPDLAWPRGGTFRAAVAPLRCLFVLPTDDERHNASAVAERLVWASSCSENAVVRICSVPQPQQVCDMRLPATGQPAHAVLRVIVDHYDELVSRFDRLAVVPARVYFAESEFGKSVRARAEYVSRKLSHYDTFFDAHTGGGLARPGFRLSSSADGPLAPASPRPLGKWVVRWLHDVSLCRSLPHNSLFSVPARQLALRNRSEYRDLLAQFVDCERCEAVHYLERVWHQLFRANHNGRWPLDCNASRLAASRRRQRGPTPRPFYRVITGERRGACGRGHRWTGCRRLVRIESTCRGRGRMDPRLLIGVQSAPGAKHVHRRDAIRRTWGQWVTSSDRATMRFVLGGRGLAGRERHALQAEASARGDILWLLNATDEGVPTVKGFAWWQQAARMLSRDELTHVAKVDDDSFVHVPNLLADLELLHCHPRAYYGLLAYTGYIPHEWRVCGWSWLDPRQGLDHTFTAEGCEAKGVCGSRRPCDARTRGGRASSSRAAQRARTERRTAPVETERGRGTRVLAE
mmetsp:Transcript_61535/g.183281  ORF Transcript_61535/g.183281 Transcript_61535/m.183281 type:complete len:522 (+) Transcript_61535:53-1618(+)